MNAMFSILNRHRLILNFILFIIISLFIGCSREREEVSQIDYKILSLVFDVVSSKNYFDIEKVYFQRGGMGAPGELTYKVKAESVNFFALLEKLKATSLRHGPLTHIFPFEINFFGENTQNLRIAYLVKSKLHEKNGSTNLTETYILIDSTTSPSLTLFIKTDPRYVISKL